MGGFPGFLQIVGGTFACKDSLNKWLFANTIAYISVRKSVSSQYAGTGEDVKI